MALCSKCRMEFPTCYMDTVSICPNCNTTFYNDSPYFLSNEVPETPGKGKQSEKKMAKRRTKAKDKI